MTVSIRVLRFTLLSISPPKLLNHIHLNTVVTIGRDSSLGIANRYGLDVTGIESRWG